MLRHTGVAWRHESELPVEQMAALAAREALGDGPPPDLVLCASTVPRQLVPDDAPFVAQALGLSGVPAFSVRATCLSFVVALQVAASWVHTGAARRVLVVSADRGLAGINPAEPESAALFGDGAAAVVVEPTPPGERSAVLAWRMATWPEGAALTEVRGGGLRRHPNDPATRPEDNLFHMDGLAVYRMARERLPEVLGPLLAEAGVGAGELDLIVPHQASGGAVKALRRYGLDAARVVDCVAEHGNCVSASIPLALATACAEGRVRRGMTVLLVGTGAGLSAAGMVLRW